MKRTNGFLTAWTAAIALAGASALAGPPAHGAGAGNARQTQIVLGATQHGATQRQMQLEKMAKTAIRKLRRDSRNAAQALGEAYGVAVFNIAKGGALITGIGGPGVAMKLNVLDRPQSSAQTTFMHVGGKNAAPTAGASSYRLVVLLENKTTYRQFTNGEWTGASSAQARAGKTLAGEAVWRNGVKVYRMTSTGVTAGVDVGGLRFWPSGKLDERSA